MSEEACPVKLQRIAEGPPHKMSRYHEWSWEPSGVDEHGAILKRGTCKLCKCDLGVERFCACCGRKLENAETGPECNDCVREMAPREVQKRMTGEKVKNLGKHVTDIIYRAYGSGTGYLFGIEPQHRRAVETIVTIALDEVGIDDLEQAREE